MIDNVKKVHHLMVVEGILVLMTFLIYKSLAVAGYGIVSLISQIIHQEAISIGIGKKMHLN
jgi:hypothetical protein